MTGKRFVLNNIVEKGTVSFWDNKKQKILNASHSLDLLNDLSDENEQLKYKYNEKCNEYCGLEEQVDALLKENEQLKQYKDAVLNCNSSKIIRVNRNTGEFDLIDKEHSDES